MRMCGCDSCAVWATSTCWRSAPRTRPSPCLNYRSEVSRRPTSGRVRQDPHHHQHRSTPNRLLLLHLPLPRPLLRHRQAVMTNEEDGGACHRWDDATRRNDDSDIRQHKRQRQRRRRWRTRTLRESHAAPLHSPFSRWTCASARPRPWHGSPTTPKRPACLSSAEANEASAPSNLL